MTPEDKSDVLTHMAQHLLEQVKEHRHDCRLFEVAMVIFDPTDFSRMEVVGTCHVGEMMTALSEGVEKIARDVRADYSGAPGGN